jgi:hypothetical protein
MSSKYGPWATPINAGMNPQLSAFWKRRLRMLVTANQTSPVLSRQSLLWLCALGSLMIVLPTFRTPSAVADEEKPARIPNEITPSSAQEKNIPAQEQKPSEQSTDSPQDKKQKKNSPAAEAAQLAYEATVQSYETGRSDIEAVYRWSCRWMQAERADRGVLAIQSHLDRMQSFADKIKSLNDAGAPGGEAANLTAVRYYVVEAKEMVEEAKRAVTKYQSR